MTRLLFSAQLIACAVLAGAASAQIAPPPGVAQGTEPVRGYMRHHPPVIRSPAVVEPVAHDAPTREEVLRHVRAMFERFDTNHDGFVTKDELTRARSEMWRSKGARLRAAHDHPAGPHTMGNPNRMFDRLDTNHDGVLSREEFIAGHMEMERHMQSLWGVGATARDRANSRSNGASANGDFIERLFAAADRNGDGRISLQEAQAAALRHFDRMHGRAAGGEGRNGSTMIPDRPND